MPRPDPFATNAYGVQVQPIDWLDEASPRAKTYHGLSIVSNNMIIGRITSWNPTAYSRTVTLQYELSNLTFGRPVDNIPGQSTGYTVTGTSAEIWEYEIERRIQGDPNASIFSDGASQRKAFTVQEHWFRGENIYRIWEYKGCWLTERNEDPYASDGDARVMANFTFQYVNRSRLT